MLAELSRISDNWIRTVTKNRPEWIPTRVLIPYALWINHGKELEQLLLKYRSLFPNYVVGSWAKHLIPPDKRFVQGKFMDSWGCEWTVERTGYPGTVSVNPLKSWSILPSFSAPDPMILGEFERKPDWEDVSLTAANNRKSGTLTVVSFTDRFIYSRLSDLRGIPELSEDFECEKPELVQLIQLVESYYAEQVKKYLETGASVFMFADDPDHGQLANLDTRTFRDYIKPSYRRLFGLINEGNGIVHYSLKGNAHRLLEHLLECYVHIISADLSSNRLEELADMQEWASIDCYIDSAAASSLKPWEIRTCITRIIRSLAQEKGGLLLTLECPSEMNLTTLEIFLKVLEELGGPYLDSEAIS